MTAGLKFENFAVGSHTSEPPKSVVEENLLAAYERGYAAGWDDAVAAQEQERNSVSADLAESLRQISLAKEDIRSETLKSVESLFHEMVTAVLPRIAAASLGKTVVETLQPLMAEKTDLNVELVINPENAAAIASLLRGMPGKAVMVIEEPTLSAGQAFLRLGETEKSIDLDEVLETIAASVNAYFSTKEFADAE